MFKTEKRVRSQAVITTIAEEVTASKVESRLVFVSASGADSYNRTDILTNVIRIQIDSTRYIGWVTGSQPRYPSYAKTSPYGVGDC